MKKRLMSLILCVVILVTSGISCFAVSTNEAPDAPNDNVIKYIKADENYDDGSNSSFCKNRNCDSKCGTHSFSRVWQN